MAKKKKPKTQRKTHGKKKSRTSVVRSKKSSRSKTVPKRKSNRNGATKKSRRIQKTEISGKQFVQHTRRVQSRPGKNRKSEVIHARNKTRTFVRSSVNFVFPRSRRLTSSNFELLKQKSIPLFGKLPDSFDDIYYFKIHFRFEEDGKAQFQRFSSGMVRIVKEEHWSRYVGDVISDFKSALKRYERRVDSEILLTGSSAYSYAEDEGRGKQKTKTKVRSGSKNSKRQPKRKNKIRRR